ncbi:MAG TPA: two-component sensor histidine kinase [candidate division Zixibacteria bacterium]|nr:two-component sensor histidine kinase [candidate division Zixibacteria bacterium]HBZ01823.1 two-component sensor histidine kinase [candidate division Zixibacteria bacterium]
MASSKHKSPLYVGYSWFFKAFLIIGLVGVVGLFIYFNQTVVRDLRHDAAKVSEAYARLIQYGASEATDPAVINFIFDNIITQVNFPIIVTDRRGIPAAWTMKYSPSDTSTATRAILYAYIKEFDSQNKPIEIRSDSTVISLLHYGDSAVIGKLRLIPIVEMTVLSFFILIAFVGFRNIKQAEQRSIWVGMAKETAHQLGTPLSSLIGWVELLKMRYQEGKIQVSPDVEGDDFSAIMDRMHGDLNRLDRIATRFGRIGSAPELSEYDLNEIVRDVLEYLKVRLPSGGMIIKETYGDLPAVSINPELMRWVVENLVKNSMEASNAKTGIISITTSYSPTQKKVLILVEDNGPGVPAGKQKKIFSPGFTTKKRGWGLGLTLARRIVEEYHGGKISLRSSEPNVKTIFVVELPA